MQVDYLVVGQGICGTLLSRQLLKEGKTVILVDKGTAFSSSSTAGGIINPVTGKRLVSSWMIEQLQPLAWNTYTAFGQEFGVTIIQQCDILDFYATQEVRSIFIDRQQEGNSYLHAGVKEEDWADYFRFNYGIGRIAPGMLVDITSMLAKWSQFLNDAGLLLQETFDLQDCVITNDKVVYKHISAGKVIFCDGVSAVDNPYFNMLPWSKDKGEALVVFIPGLPATSIFRQGSISIVPWHSGLFWVGAAHDWKFTDMLPSPAFRKRVEAQLNYWLKLPYQVIDHIAAQRPATLDRKPFVGIHPMHPTVGIFNGMGGKGCSQAPYFAHQFTQYLMHGSPILPHAAIARFTKMLGR